MNDAALFAELDRLLGRGERAVLATVVATQGSTPRKAGAKMLVREDGTFLGTICGGCIEAEVYARGRELFGSSAKPLLLSFTLNEREAADYGLRCGGTMEVYVERIMPRPVLCLVGAGHIAQALHAVAGPLGFETRVLDDHPGFANEERFPGAAVVVKSFEEIPAEIPDGAHVAVLIATRGHNHDAAVFRRLVERPFGYLGLVTSKKRFVEFCRDYLADGVSEEALRRVKAPAGLDVGSETPEEIAVAVMAEILSVVRGGAQVSLSTLFWDSPAGRKIPGLAPRDGGSPGA